MRKLDVPAGTMFGRLVVVKELERHINPCGKKKRKFLCLCACGNETEVELSNLRNGNTSSCGCYGKENLKRAKKFNCYEFYEDSVIGYTNDNTPFLVDVEDYEKIKDYCWCRNKAGYLVAQSGGRLIRMHRLIMDAPENLVVDHINHDVADNRKGNLRVCSQQQNAMNTNAKGYYFNKGKGKWTAEIMLNKKRIHLGHFNTEQEAVDARRVAEKKYFGEFAFNHNVH